VLTLAALMAAGGSVGASATGTAAQVAIGYSDYEPNRIDVVAGGTVDWTNDSVRNHTVTDDAGAYDSGTLPSTYKFAHTFETPGAFTYHCRLHPYIRGEVDVWEVLMDQPPGTAQAGVPYPLSGDSALAGGSSVDIEADDGSGAGFVKVGEATVDPDGSFTAKVTPTGSESYRAVAGGQASPAVNLLVLNHSVVASVRRGRKSTVVSAQVTPADPGGYVVLQLRLRERFGWWPVAQRRLDKSSRARFVLPAGTTAPARVRLTLPDGATPLATSPALRLR
jgi:plastocyanin